MWGVGWRKCLCLISSKWFRLIAFGFVVLVLCNTPAILYLVGAIAAFALNVIRCLACMFTRIAHANMVNIFRYDASR